MDRLSTTVIDQFLRHRLDLGTIRSIDWVTRGSYALVVLLAFRAYTVVYNIWLHPLRGYPGPFLYRATRWTYFWHFTSGDLMYKVRELHEKYGPVVRIAPNELAFNDVQAWKDIYGHRVGLQGGMKEMPKYLRFYKTWDAQPHSLLTAPQGQHSVLRRHLAHGFSDKSMREQMPLIGKYVDLLIDRLHENLSKGPLNMVSWYNWTTFDVIGDLAFGDPFYCLEKSDYDPWVKLIFKGPKENSRVTGLRTMGFDNVALVLLSLAARSGLQTIEKAKQKMKKRVEMGVGRPDLMNSLIQKKDELNLDNGSLTMTANLVIFAGSETTATLLSGVTFLLLTHPEALAKVTEEVRSTFNAEDEITLTSVSSLHYMLACLNEAMRCYPPVAGGLPRVVPEGGAMIAGRPVPQNTVVAVWQYAAYHNSSNFNMPFEFHPERFLHDERFKTDKTDVLQPFSVGPRNCIGRNLAYAEMRLILARVLYNFDMKLEGDSVGWLDDQRAFTLWRKPALNVRLTPRPGLERYHKE